MRTEKEYLEINASKYNMFLGCKCLNCKNKWEVSPPVNLNAVLCPLCGKNYFSLVGIRLRLKAKK